MLRLHQPDSTGRGRHLSGGGLITSFLPHLCLISASLLPHFYRRHLSGGGRKDHRAERAPLDLSDHREGDLRRRRGAQLGPHAVLDGAPDGRLHPTGVHVSRAADALHAGETIRSWMHTRVGTRARARARMPMCGRVCTPMCTRMCMRACGCVLGGRGVSLF